MEEEKVNNPSAFPIRHEDVCCPDGSRFTGMTLLDYFAAKAMQGLVSRCNPNEGWSDSMSNQAYFIAESMLKERQKRGL